MPNNTHAKELLNLFANLQNDLRPQAAPKVWEMIFSMFPGPGKALNAGAGRGGLSWVMDQAGYKVVSVDLHPTHFQVKGLNCELIDLTKPLPFSEGEFELVIAVEVMEHLENPWLFFREALRVLQEGGRFVFTSPNVMSLNSRLIFTLKGLFPYFRDESFFGCYHVTPIFDWAVRRCCTTCCGKIDDIRFSRVEWPRHNDVPRYPGRLRRLLLGLLPCNRLLGEIAGYSIVKDSTVKQEISVGHHPNN